MRYYISTETHRVHSEGNCIFQKDRPTREALFTASGTIDDAVKFARQSGYPEAARCQACANSIVS